MHYNFKLYKVVMLVFIVFKKNQKIKKKLKNQNKNQQPYQYY